MKKRMYLCIDLKSFYASVECVERGFDPMTTNLIVADPERSEKTICLAVTPAMKALGVKNRCRVFEIPKSIEYIMAEPRMQKYIDYAAEIYAIYLKFVSKDDIHVYSIDEVFVDVTDYLSLYGMTAKELGIKMMTEVFEKLGIRATCGVGTNLYLAKVALDITAKHSSDFVGILDEETYCKTLWTHRPITDFWRIGRGTARRLESMGIYDMGGITRCNEEYLYKKFGIDAELLIDHAWGREPVTMADIKNYKPKSNCLTSGQVLMCDYGFEDGRIIVKEMMELLCLDMVEKGLVTKSITLYVGYSNTLNMEPARGSAAVDIPTNADSQLVPLAAELYGRIVNPLHPIRRVNISCNGVTEEKKEYVQLSLFDDSTEKEKSRKIQNAIIGIKKQFGKNAVFKGIDLGENATTLERNRQIGGHKSGE
ncbi:MAG: DNA repair protein [Ruminococcaceae bacterium]|nr:DNA repair protein [Oscillospiraceae bacterium]